MKHEFPQESEFDSAESRTLDMRRYRWLILVVMFVILAVGGLLFVRGLVRTHEFSSTPLKPPQPVPDITGVNWDGNPFRLSSLQGKVVMIFFGYTSCPDVCPLTLADMKTLRNKLGEQSNEVAMVFITVDPERDTVERLATYVPAFSPDFYGIYLEQDALEATKKAYGIYGEKAETDSNQADENYLVDHTASISVIDRSGQRRLIFSFGTTVDEMLSDIEYLLQEG